MSNFCSDIAIFNEICGKNAIYFDPLDEDELIQIENEIFNTLQLRNMCNKNFIKSND